MASPSISLSVHEHDVLLQKQEADNPFHKFVCGNLIIKQGFLEKRVGLFARRRMFLLTEGPRLFYVDAVKMECKGEIKFDKDIRTEIKDFKVFFIHVFNPDRTYYLIDREGFAMKWVQEINAVWAHYYGTDDQPNMPSIAGSGNELVVTSNTLERPLPLSKPQTNRYTSAGRSTSSSNKQFSQSLGDSISASATVDVQNLRKSKNKDI